MVKHIIFNWKCAGSEPVGHMSCPSWVPSMLKMPMPPPISRMKFRMVELLSSWWERWHWIGDNSLVEDIHGQWSTCLIFSKNCLTVSNGFSLSFCADKLGRNIVKGGFRNMSILLLPTHLSDTKFMCTLTLKHWTGLHDFCWKTKRRQSYWRLGEIK